jgi:hypothetical protein
MDNGIATPNKSPTDRKDLVKFARREGFSYNYLISVFHTIFSISFDRRPNVTAPHKVFPSSGQCEDRAGQTWWAQPRFVSNLGQAWHLRTLGALAPKRLGMLWQHMASV